jgi:hypothetical protein
MDTALVDLLSLIETLVAVCIFMGAFKARLGNHCDDFGIPRLHFLYERRLAPTLDVCIVPSFDLTHVFHVLISHSKASSQTGKLAMGRYKRKDR